MTLVTAVAFILAVRLEAQVVAVLGILGGFLTPVLLSTGHDNPAGPLRLHRVARSRTDCGRAHRRWHFLVPLGAAGTIVMQFGWAVKFLNAAKAPTAMVVCLAFCALVPRRVLRRTRKFGAARCNWSAARSHFRSSPWFRFRLSSLSARSAARPGCFSRSCSPPTSVCWCSRGVTRHCPSSTCSLASPCLRCSQRGRAAV